MTLILDSWEWQWKIGNWFDLQAWECNRCKKAFTKFSDIRWERIYMWFINTIIIIIIVIIIIIIIIIIINNNNIFVILSR